MPHSFRSHYILLLCVSVLWGAASISSQAQPSFGTGINFGAVNTWDIWEASGIAASRQNPGVLWTHNDSQGRVFALGTNGMLLREWSLPNVGWGDFEDIALGPGPNAAFQYIYLGDIGDNYLSRSTINVYRFPEPSVYGFYSNSIVLTDVPAFETIVLQYPDGAHNAEGMIVDPKTADLFIFTKLDFSTRVYRATRAELNSGQTITLTYLTEVGFRKVSGASITPDGSLIALRRGGTAWAWQRLPGQTVDQAFQNGAYALPLVTEPNGEAIGFDPVGGGYYTTSEGYSQPIYYFPRLDLTPAQPRCYAPAGSFWLYEDSGADPDPDWFQPEGAEWFFSEGFAPFGYYSSEQTTLQPSSTFKSTATYFRSWFTVTNTAGLSNLAVRLCYSDGVAVYVNGTEVLRRDLPPNAGPATSATATNQPTRNNWQTFAISPTLLHSGPNLIAAELHRADGEPTAAFFDAQIIEAHADLPRRFVTLPKFTNGKWKIDVTGPPGTPVNVEWSNDLKTWSPLGMPVMIGEESEVEGPDDGTGLRFYRIVP